MTARVCRRACSRPSARASTPWRALAAEGIDTSSAYSHDQMLERFLTQRPAVLRRRSGLSDGAAGSVAVAQLDRRQRGLILESLIYGIDDREAICFDRSGQRKRPAGDDGIFRKRLEGLQPAR